jgi:hypothetical protein
VLLLLLLFDGSLDLLLINRDLSSALCKLGHNKSPLVLGKTADGNGDLEVIGNGLVLLGAKVEGGIQRIEPLVSRQSLGLDNNVVILLGGLGGFLGGSSLMVLGGLVLGVVEGLLLGVGRVHGFNVRHCSRGMCVSVSVCEFV